MNRSEEFVYSLCRKSFLSLWSIPNPLRKDSQKELCDVLIVCDPYVIIFSVKEIEYKPTENTVTGWKRWTSRAIEESVSQIYGAEKELPAMSQVVQKDKTPHLFLPTVERRCIHRIAAALGSKNEVPIPLSYKEKGFIHIFTEQSIEIVLREMDTIMDLTRYLTDKEDLLKNSRTQIITSGEENLLASYLQDGFESLKKTDLALLDDTWKGFSSLGIFCNKKKADKESYFWDRLIEHLIKEHDPNLTRQEGVITDPNPAIERVVRIMAKEDRFSRRILSKAFKDFYLASDKRSRTFLSQSGIRYVFLVLPLSVDRKVRMNALMVYCFVARGHYQDAKTVVGVATETHQSGQGYSIDACVFEQETWTEKNQQELKRLQTETGAFVSPIQTPFSEDEYPHS